MYAKNYCYCILIATVLMALTIMGLPQSLSIQQARQHIYTSKTDKERLVSLVELCKRRNSLHGDTIRYYAQWAKKLAIRLKDDKNLAWAEYSLISADLAKGKTDSVVEKIEKNSSFYNLKKTDESLYFKVQLLKANALNRLDNRTAALDLQLKLLNEAEKEGNLSAQLFALNFIGATYMNTAKYAEAKNSWLQGLALIKQQNNTEHGEIESYILSNLALYYYNNYYIHRSKQVSDSFFMIINRAIESSKRNENLGVLASSLSLRGNFYGLINQFTEGEKDFKAGLELRKTIGDPYYVADDLAGLSHFYLNQKKYEHCISTAQEGIELTKSNSIKSLQLQLMAIMGAAYKSMGDYQRYSLSLEQQILTADSNNRANSAEKIADIQTKYEVQKKETLIAKQQLALFWRKLFIYGGAMVTALLLGLSIYHFKKYQREQKIKLTAMMAQEKKEKELAVIRAKDQERTRIAADLHDNIGVQASAILYATELLKQEPHTNLASVENLHNTAKNMLVNLRETVWAMKHPDITAADFWIRVISFCKQMEKHYKLIKITTVGAPPPAYQLSSAKALHLMMIIQEAVSNSAKHAHANQVLVVSAVTDKNWQLVIEDNGMGFDMASIKQIKDRNGLSNMKERAKAGEAAITVESSVDNGTRVLLDIVIN
jgi:signal transduction histidine kinase